jgi:hypothetical protein
VSRNDLNRPPFLFSFAASHVPKQAAPTLPTRAFASNNKKVKADGPQFHVQLGESIPKDIFIRIAIILTRRMPSDESRVQSTRTEGASDPH